MSNDNAQDDEPFRINHLTVVPGATRTRLTEEEKARERGVVLDHDLDRPLGEAVIEFDEHSSYAFKDLIRDTLEDAGSRYIETRWDGERLIITEV